MILIHFLRPATSHIAVTTRARMSYKLRQVIWPSLCTVKRVNYTYIGRYFFMGWSGCSFQPYSIILKVASLLHMMLWYFIPNSTRTSKIFHLLACDALVLSSKLPPTFLADTSQQQSRYRSFTPSLHHTVLHCTWQAPVQLWGFHQWWDTRASWVPQDNLNSIYHLHVNSFPSLPFPHSPCIMFWKPTCSLTSRSLYPTWRRSLLHSDV